MEKQRVSRLKNTLIFDVLSKGQFGLNRLGINFDLYQLVVIKEISLELINNQILYDKLKEEYPSIKRQYKVEWCKDKKQLPFDLVIEERNIIVEVDGDQHWKQVAKWKTPEHNRVRDIYKMKCANDNGFSVIRIIQEDIYKNKYNWLNELIYNIEKITNENVVQNIYMCKKDEYKYFDISN